MKTIILLSLFVLSFSSFAECINTTENSNNVHETIDSFINGYVEASSLRVNYFNIKSGVNVLNGVIDSAIVSFDYKSNRMVYTDVLTIKVLSDCSIEAVGDYTLVPQRD